jgi:hypothetical protein
VLTAEKNIQRTNLASNLNSLQRKKASLIKSKTIFLKKEKPIVESDSFKVGSKKLHLCHHFNYHAHDHDYEYEAFQPGFNIVANQI